MNGSSPENLPPLGKKIEPPVIAPAEPTWKPLRPGYETKDGAIRRTTESLMDDLSPWAEYIRHHQRGGYGP